MVLCLEDRARSPLADIRDWFTLNDAVGHFGTQFYALLQQDADHLAGILEQSVAHLGWHELLDSFRCQSSTLIRQATDSFLVAATETSTEMLQFMVSSLFDLQGLLPSSDAVWYHLSDYFQEYQALITSALRLQELFSQHLRAGRRWLRRSFSSIAAVVLRIQAQAVCSVRPIVLLHFPRGACFTAKTSSSSDDDDLRSFPSDHAIGLYRKGRRSGQPTDTSQRLPRQLGPASSCPRRSPVARPLRGRASALQVPDSACRRSGRANGRRGLGDAANTRRRTRARPLVTRQRSSADRCGRAHQATPGSALNHGGRS